jgi:transposase
MGERMPRGQYYPEELREEARKLRHEGYSLNEIAARLGPPKNTLTLWVRDIALTPEQRARLHQREIEANRRNRALASMAYREARLERN